MLVTYVAQCIGVMLLVSLNGKMTRILEIGTWEMFTFTFTMDGMDIDR